MTPSTPDWLARHGGEVSASPDGESVAVYFGHEPQYVLRVLPADGKYICHVKQTINGKHLGTEAVHATADDALRGGLEDLRKALGW
jgi:hypothetical protein